MSVDWSIISRSPPNMQKTSDHNPLDRLGLLCFKAGAKAFAAGPTHSKVLSLLGPKIIMRNLWMVPINEGNGRRYQLFHTLHAQSFYWSKLMSCKLNLKNANHHNPEHLFFFWRWGMVVKRGNCSMVGSINRNHLPGASEWSKALAYFAAFRRLFVPQLNLADMMTSWVVCDESHRDIHWMYPPKKVIFSTSKVVVFSKCSSNC